ncbi:hypothetical protein GCM10022252_27230 [Streptosporangium oxazolinicum]|uniref:Uncharacterized protein n=1 Tax=Streptosporangium oxazolinicum TaxID=909287 RepID=A0ABP8ATN4_9ACTN
MAEVVVPDVVPVTGATCCEAEVAAVREADALAVPRPVTRANVNETATSDDSCPKGRVFMVGQRLLQVWIKRAESPPPRVASPIATRLDVTLTGQRG